MSRFQDIALSDANLKAEFITRFFNGDYLNLYIFDLNNPFY